MWTWALELECARMDEQGGRRRGKKKVNPYPFISGRKLRAPTSLVKLAYPPGAVIDGAVGLPTSVLMGIP